MVARPKTRAALAANVRDALTLIQASGDLLTPYETRLVRGVVHLLDVFAAGLEGRTTAPEGS